MFRKLFTVYLLTATLGVYSQQNTTADASPKAPLSIYTDGTPITSFNFESNLPSKVLTSKAFQFRIVAQGDIERNIFTLDLRNLSRKGSTYDIESYRKAALNKYFQVVPDIIEINRFSDYTSLRKN